MKSVAWATWVARFDMESLVSAILRWGTLASGGLILLGLIAARCSHAASANTLLLQGANLTQVLSASVSQAVSTGAWPALAIHLGLVALLATSYLRVLACAGYFIFIERSWRHALLSGAAAAVLTYVLWIG